MADMSVQKDFAPATTLPPFWAKRKLDSSKLSIEDAVNHFLTDRTNCNHRTKQNYRFALNRFAQFMRAYGLQYLSDIDGDMLSGYVESLFTPYDPTTASRMETNKRAWLEQRFWATQWSQNYIADLCRPVGTLIEYYQKRGKISRFYYELPEEDDNSPLFTPTNEEFDQILGACQSKRDYLIILLMGDTGMRRLEIINANWDDIQSDRILVIGKGSKLRAIPLSPRVRDELNEYRQQLPKRDTGKKQPIFRTAAGNRMPISAFQSVINRLRTATQLNFSAHSIRRYAMRTWLKAGRTVEEIRDAAGHVHLETTYHYLGRFEPVVTDNSLKTSAVEYLATNKLIRNVNWQTVQSNRGRSSG
ncbi:MAG: site-specific integrase [Chloroflexi bacterium]|nr:site-specific integrase [Chloroflexota bacterium]